MATTQPLLSGVTLPHPYAYEEESEYRETWVEFADGSVFTDLVQADAKLLFILRFHGLGAVQKSNVETAYIALAESYSTDNFTSPTGVIYTVQRDPAQVALSWDAQPQANGILRWQTELRLREV